MKPKQCANLKKQHARSTRPAGDQEITRRLAPSMVAFLISCGALDILINQVKLWNGGTLVIPAVPLPFRLQFSVLVKSR